MLIRNAAPANLRGARPGDAFGRRRAFSVLVALAALAARR